MTTLYVLAYLDRTAAGAPRVVRYGPTSESPGMLRAHRGHEPICITSAVLPVLPGSLLRVSRAAAEKALRAAGSTARSAQQAAQ